jgi:hypothetical protein
MDDGRNGRWLTYSELAAVRGINRASAVKLVQRERWPRSSGNDRQRTVRVLVPEDWLTPAKEFRANTEGNPSLSREDTGMMATLTARAERAEQRADEANKRADVAVALADRTLARLTEVTAQADQAEKRADQAWTLVERWAASEKEARRELVIAQGDLQRVREAADRLQQVEAAQAEAQKRATDAETAAEELRQAEAARRGQGRWHRLRAAWRGE